MVAITFAMTAFGTQLQPQLSDLGVPGGKAAMIGVAFTAAVVAGRLICGLMLDRFWPPAVASGVLLMPLAAVPAFLLPHAPVWLLTVGAALMGFAQGADGNVLGFFVARYFGVRAYGAIYGVLYVAVGVPLAAGQVFGGASYDRTGNYHLMMAVTAVLSIASATSLMASGVLGRRHSAIPEASASEDPQRVVTGVAGES